MGDFIQLGIDTKSGLYGGSTTWKSEIYAEIKSISQTEFYQAKGANVKAEIKFIIYQSEYNDEQKVKYNNKEYRVERTYLSGLDKIELTCSRC